MQDEQLFLKVKQYLRFKHNKLDGEIADTIAEAERDLSVSGVRGHPEDDPLWTQAIKLYARWQYNFQGEGERYHQMYSELRNAMGLCSEYKKREEAGE